MRAVFLCLLAGAVSACTLLPREEIATFTTAYGDVDQAARAVYSAYSSRQRAAEAAPPTGVADRFSPGYLLVLDKAVASSEQDVTGPVAPRIAALDSMLAFNDGLTGLAEGRRVAAVKASLAPVSATLGAALGPYAGVARQGLALLIKGIEAARSREDLQAALSTNISVTYNDSIKKKSVTLNGHPTDVLLRLLAADVHDFKIKVKAWASGRFLALSEEFAVNPSPALLAERAAVVDNARDFMGALDAYERLLERSRLHFDVLRQAAFTDSKVLQTAEFARLTFDLGADARALIRSIR